MTHPRTAAVRALARVLGRGQSAAVALEELLPALPNPRDRAFTQALVYTVLRFYPRYRATVDARLAKPLKDKDFDLYLALICGVCQLLDMRVADHAALADTVEIARHLGKKWATGLLNGVLRRVQREGEACRAAWRDTPEARHAHPAWWLARLQQDWPEDWEAIVEANNEPPPMTLRVNARQSDRAAYLAQLKEAGIAARPAPHTDFGIVLDTPVDVVQLPGFADGVVSVQDAAAQLAAPLLDCQPGMRVLDACAAPGGKLAHILETCPDCEAVAVEAEEKRLSPLRDTLRRLRLPAEVVHGDAARPGDWWDERLFDRILIDAPCSASGVIRRHPDSKYLRRESDIPVLAALQRDMLQALWRLLAPGGRMVYVTCSVLSDENTQQLVTFLQQNSDAREESIAAEWGVARPVGRQIPSGRDGMDGFYFARVRKNDPETH